MYPFDMEGVLKNPSYTITEMIFQKKVHKYTFFEKITDNAMSISMILIVYFGCTSSVLREVHP